MEYRIKRSNRKTIGIEIYPDGVLVRAPHRTSEKKIERVLEEHREWIESHLEVARQKKSEALKEGPLTPEDIRRLADEAREWIPRRVAHYAPLIGVQPGRITIRSQKTKWGSCSSAGNLNFNCLLMLTPPEVIDSIVVHELCHLKEMNHSKRFYEEVLRVFPDYRKWNRWLKEHGNDLMERMAAGRQE